MAFAAPPTGNRSGGRSRSGLALLTALAVLASLFFWTGLAAAEELADLAGAETRIHPSYQEVADYVTAYLRSIEPGKQIVYLSGPVSTGGTGSFKGNVEAMRRASVRLEAAGYAVVPVAYIEQGRYRTMDLPSGWTVPRDEVQETMKHWNHATAMTMWSEVLASNPRIEDIVVLPGFRSSTGAVQEVAWMIRAGKRVQMYHEGPGGEVELEPLPYHPVLSTVEHTLLDPKATVREIEREARWARSHRARAMVVRPEHMERVARVLAGSPTVPKAVIGFPRAKFTGIDGENALPRVPTAEKIRDLEASIEAAARGGAQGIELDMVIDVHGIKEAQALLDAGKRREAAARLEAVRQDIVDVILAAKERGQAHGMGAKVMVILETSLFRPEERRAAATVVRGTRALAAKTSTGYGPRGASPEDIRELDRILGRSKLIKASGGVGTHNIGELRRLGAHVFGASSTRSFQGTAWGKPGGTRLFRGGRALPADAAHRKARGRASGLRARNRPARAHGY